MNGVPSSTLGAVTSPCTLIACSRWTSTCFFERAFKVLPLIVHRLNTTLFFSLPFSISLHILQLSHVDKIPENKHFNTIIRQVQVCGVLSNYENIYGHHILHLDTGLVPFGRFVCNLNPHWFLRLLRPSTAPPPISLASGRFVWNISYPRSRWVYYRWKVLDVLHACIAILLVVPVIVDFVR